MVSFDAGGGGGGGSSGNSIIIDFSQLPNNSCTTILFRDGMPILIMQRSSNEPPSSNDGLIASAESAAVGHGPNAQGYLNSPGGITPDEVKAYAAKAFGWSPGNINIRFDVPYGYELKENGTFSGARGVTDWSRDENGTVIDGKVDIFLSPSVLVSFTQLFLTLGHEMVHADDHLTFGFDNFSSSASEYNAWSWSYTAAKGLGPLWDAVAAGFRDERDSYTKNPAYSYNVTTTYIRP
jgi:hypothetical protein